MTATKAQREMAKVFRRAANGYLSPREQGSKRLYEYSCETLVPLEGWQGPALALVLRYGVMPNINQFDEFPRGIQRQGARFLWLHFVAEGLERGEIEL